MSLPSAPAAEKRKKLLAGFVALVSRLRSNIQSLVSMRLRIGIRLAAVLVLTAMLLPAFGLSGGRRAKAESIRVATPPPVSAPPEPYIVPRSQGAFASPWNDRVVSSIGSIASSFAAAVLPNSGSGRSLGRKSKTKTVESTESKNSANAAVVGAEPIEPATEAEAVPAPMPQPAAAVDFDFDGDGKADIGRWNPANAEFKVKNSNGGSYSTYTGGSTGARSAPGDYDGDGTPTWPHLPPGRGRFGKARMDKPPPSQGSGRRVTSRRRATTRAGRRTNWLISVRPTGIGITGRFQTRRLLQ